jgi:methyl-accepting chemotaxis protein
MSGLKDVGIGKKLIGGFLVGSMICAIVGVVGFLGMGQMMNGFDQVTTNRMPSVDALLTMSDAINAVMVGERGLINSRLLDPQMRQAQYAYIDKAWAGADKAWRIYEPLPQTREEARVWSEFVPLWNNWKSGHEQVRRLCERKDQLMAAGMDTDGSTITALDGETFRTFLDARSNFLVANEKLVRLIEINREVAQAEGLAADRTQRRAQTALVIFTLIGAAVSLFMGYYLSRGITGPLARGVEMMQELGRGRLGRRLHLSRRDEIGVLADTMDSFADDLQNQVVGSMKRIAAGDLSVEPTPKDSKDEITPALQATIHTLRNLITESVTLSRAAVEGKLSTRGDSGKFQGGYREIVDGVNQTLDSVIQPLQEAGSVLERVANRDLSARMTGEYRGDVAKFKTSLNLAVTNLDDSMQQVAMAVEQVAAAAGQIGVGSQSLAQGASEQASSLEEVSSSLQEINSMTQGNAANAKEARGLSEGARQSASRGLEGMQRMSEAMEKIKVSSDSTAKILKTIDEIAFQTNLLALNAAVEAARAGDAGKGFAVVAEEVRNLAMRSAEAAKNTANLIEESVQNAEGGVALNREVLTQLEEIANQANKVTEVMREIALSSEQEQMGIAQITTAVDQMNQVTQQNAAGSQESASAGEELTAQAQELRSLVSQFRVTHAVTSTHNIAKGSTMRATGTDGRQMQGSPAAGPRPKLGLVRGNKPSASDLEKLIPMDSGDEDALRRF